MSDQSLQGKTAKVWAVNCRRQRRRVHLDCWKERYIDRLKAHLRLPAESRAFFQIKTWVGSRNISVLVDSEVWFPTSRLKSHIQMTFDPAKIETHEIVPLGEQYKWQPAGRESS